MSSTDPTSILAPATTAVGRVVFGADATAIRAHGAERELAIALPVLGGTAAETLITGTEPPRSEEGCTVFADERRVAGFAVSPPTGGLETTARELYRRVFAATRGRHLYRIWNYVPQINAVHEGLENYRRFCRGRSHAFEDQFGKAFQRQLPAASAVGAGRGPLAVAFLAGLEPPRHFENPRQVPAFEYPPAYGPRPPSFSRATLVTTGTQRELFISGTAAIRGHMTVAADDLARQLACMRDNLHVIAATAGAGAEFGAADGWRRLVKVYLRHDTDLLQVKNDLERHLLRPSDVVTYLQADLCRADLRVEIEAILTQD